MTDLYHIARVNMVESQIRPNRVYDADLLNAMLNVPRELFLPEPLRGVAYSDEAVKFAPGRYLTQPLVLARLLETAGIEAGHKVLIVGAGTGYSAAIAAHMAGQVVALEEYDELRPWAEDCLRRVGVTNVSVVGGPPARGCAGQAPFDRIVIDGAVPEIPHALLDQLAPGGRLTAIVTRPGHAPQGMLAERVGQGISARVVFDGTAHPLPGFQKKPEFAFA